MKRVLLLAVALVAGLAAPSASAGTGAALPTPGFASDNVEWLGNVPLHADSAGARLHGGYLYVTSSSQLSIYDVKVPESPTLVSTTPLPQMPYFAEEDVDTNGTVLVVGTSGLMVTMDVRDKARPALLSVLQGTDEHTMSCVLDCRFVYGSAGVIVDLTDPAKPVKLATKWTAAVTPAVTSTHDVTEVAPGMVMTSSKPLVLLDATDPTKPKQLATAQNPDGRFMHANLWPRAMQDKLLLVGGETNGTDCDDPKAGAFMTYDTTAWRKDRSKPLELKDSYRPAVTSVPEGDAAYETYCSHWFTTRPGWEDGGQLAVGWYEHGTRFLQVDGTTGAIKEIGYFTPVATTSSAAYWVTKDVLYVMDYQRGLDILRFHDDKKAPRSQREGARGLAPDVAPATRNRLLPGMLRASGARC